MLEAPHSATRPPGSSSRLHLGHDGHELARSRAAFPIYHLGPTFRSANLDQGGGRDRLCVCAGGPPTGDFRLGREDRDSDCACPARSLAPARGCARPPELWPLGRRGPSESYATTVPANGNSIQRRHRRRDFRAAASRDSPPRSPSAAAQWHWRGLKDPQVPGSRSARGGAPAAWPRARDAASNSESMVGLRLGVRELYHILSIQRAL